MPFWICDTCKNYVGCHHKTNERTKPLGSIPNKEIREARKHIHALLDPMWKDKEDMWHIRGKIYKYLTEKLGYKYHTAEIKTIEEAREVYKLLIQYRKDMNA